MGEPMPIADDGYFESYEDLEVHKLMLNDTVRNEAYKKAIFENKEKFLGATVLDVGAGTGILSVFCAQAGAAKVFAVEKSNTFKIALDIAKENNFENIIQVINESIENLNALPGVNKVDIIVSEWMGFYLLHEGMADSVIHAREKFLKPGGLIFPEYAMIYTSPCSFPDLYNKWDDVSGISMKTFATKLRDSINKPETVILNPDCILSEGKEYVWLDFKECTVDDLKLLSNKQHAVAKMAGKLQGICIWFEVIFPGEKHLPVTLSTDPCGPPTHWKQTVLVLPKEIDVEEGQPIFYSIEMKKVEENLRRYNIALEMLDPEEEEHEEYCLCHMTKCILTRAMYKKYEEEAMQS